jgi:putative phosphoesterase
MEKVAVISDVHANLEALEEVLRRIRGMTIYCLGDLVDYGANPNEVVEMVRKESAVVIMGNHDQAVVTGDASLFNPKAAISSIWTRQHLNRENLDYLKGLPTEWKFELDGVSCRLVHGSPDEPLWEYVYPSTHHLLFGHYLKKLGVRCLGLGHTHVPFVWEENEGVVFNPGSVGQPRDGDRRASYAILDAEGKDVGVVIRRVEYDIEGAALKIRKAGLPPVFAERLLTGD